MSTGHHALHQTHAGHIPANCNPVDDTLAAVSDCWRTCIPTYLALASTALGTCSIVAWLFAQLPQIYKNMKMQSTAGLSASFLVVWCVGDISNLLGALLTGQATWQVVIGAYYSSVDLVLVGQYIYYERLGYGRKARRKYRNRIMGARGNRGGGEGERLLASGEDSTAYGSATDSTSTQNKSNSDSSLGAFKFPTLMNPGAREKNQSSQALAGKKTVPMPKPTGSYAQSPTAILLVACICLAFGRASPVSLSSHSSFAVLSRTISPSAQPVEDPLELVGRIISWCSTFFYLISRLPQLIKNYRRKSTAGLSPTLFAAAFCGNLFYSSSLLTNPLAWASYGPYGHRGWAGPDGSNQAEWVLSATPFFLGAAGVLALDAAVGVQFFVYGDGRKQRYTPRILEVQVDAASPSAAAGIAATADGPRRSRFLDIPPGGSHHQPPEEFESGSWRRVSGYMRGWVPSFSPGSWSGRGGYMAAAALDAARDRIAGGLATPSSATRSRVTSPDGRLAGRGEEGGAWAPPNRNIRGIREEAEAWESRRNSRQGSLTSQQRDGPEDDPEDRSLLEGDAGRFET